MSRYPTPILALVLAAILPPATLAQQTTRVSVSSGGSEANSFSETPGISADGRFMSFMSGATNLVPGDTNGFNDVFVHDRLAATTTRINLSYTGAEADGLSYETTISLDGRYVAYRSSATNLVPGDTNNRTDIFLYDRSTAITTRVSVNSSGVQGNQGSDNPVLSADGQVVVFGSGSTNLVPGDTNGFYDVFVHEVPTGVTTLVSISTAGVQANARCIDARLSADGRFVAFSSLADNLVANDLNGEDDIFLHDRSTGVTTRISVAPGGWDTDDESRHPFPSADGRYVAFTSDATNLVPGDTNNRSDVFLHDRWTGITERCSVSSAGNEGNHTSSVPQLSLDARWVLFRSTADNLVPGDVNLSDDLFVRDRQAGWTSCASLSSLGLNGNADSSEPRMSADGRFVAFSSVASDLVPGDTNSSRDIFLRERCQTLFEPFGLGLAGTGELIPYLAGTNADCSSYQVHTWNALGGAPLILWASARVTDIPLFGGRFYIDLTGAFSNFDFTLGGPAGLAGQGTISLTGINLMPFIGAVMYVQGTVFDPGAVRGIAFTNGLVVEVGG